MSQRLIIAVAVAGSMLAGTAQADEADIRAAIAAIQAAAGPDRLVIGAAPEISPSGNGYTVSFSEIAVVPEPEEAIRIDLAPMSAFVRPVTEDAYEIAVEIPSVLRLTEDGDEAALLTIGEQDLAGTYDAALGTFTQLDARLAELRFLPGEPLLAEGLSAGDHVALEQLRAVMDFKEDESGLWSGVVRGEAAGLSVILEDSPVAGLGHFAAETELRRVAAQHLADLVGTFDPAATELEPLDLAAELQEGVGGLRWSVSLRDLDASNLEDGSRFAIGDLEGWLDIDGLDRPRAAVSAGFTQTGLVLDDPDIPEGLLPETLSLSLALDEVPGMPVWAEHRQVLEAAPMAAIGLLAEAGTTLTVRGGWASALGGLDLDGRLAADPDAMMGAAGALTLDVRSLEPMLAAAAQAVDQEAAAGMAGMLQAFAEPRDGGAVSRFHLELTPDGGLSLNGESMDALLAALMAQ